MLPQNLFTSVRQSILSRSSDPSFANLERVGFVIGLGQGVLPTSSFRASGLGLRVHNMTTNSFVFPEGPMYCYGGYFPKS